MIAAGKLTWQQKSPKKYRPVSWDDSPGKLRYLDWPEQEFYLLEIGWNWHRKCSTWHSQMVNPLIVAPLRSLTESWTPNLFTTTGVTFGLQKNRVVWSDFSLHGRCVDPFQSLLRLLELACLWESVMPLAHLSLYSSLLPTRGLRLFLKIVLNRSLKIHWQEQFNWG